ncbi:LuxR C-terminal-related transcriptional regulator [Dethiobacter alkaliphilus]|uniref:LuxR C-terminal-related transcriptional regulator n=1 Tax=Dethiobacter alkaliphilus TaxID=427926 RepID=UPI0022260B4B|nr:LuxR C-terminal-related transcriptional regulator [Dethiobacter alkaliphilus]MCW3489719.1 LuxR C-terminal-related transcriptional regulator [Dethiobacter alkaliphilus]
MVSEILRIKTNIPPLGTNILSRHPILERLDNGLLTGEDFVRSLTLISAPAGFGKTTLVRDWLSGNVDRTAWFSLDEGDNELVRFWIYLISALQKLIDDLGKESIAILRSGAIGSQSSGIDSFLPKLLNDLFDVKGPLYLVLDDYHLINNPLIHEGIIFFIDNLPPTLHMVVITRSDPPWPSSKWRAKGRMAEIRLEELRFSEKETGQLLGKIKQLQLNTAQINALYDKTEGWITGLQLAAFSLSTTNNTDEFIKDFAGSHRHIFHFLSDEVFSQQPEFIQDFLLHTSILQRLCGSLCNEVTGRDDSAEILTTLERNNLFVIPLDDRGVWYRYHPLFSDLLSYYLKRKYPDKVAQLHDKAGNWFLAEDEPGEAVRHTLISNNLEKVAQILHEHYGKIMEVQGPMQLNQCLEKFTPQLLEKYPRLVVHKALLHLIYQGKEESVTCLELAENLSYANKLEQQEFLALLAAVKSYYNIYTHNIPQAIKEAEKALQQLPTHNYYWRMNVCIYSGDASLFTGNPKGAYPLYLEAYKNSRQLSNHFFSLTSSFKTATSLYFMGRLTEAEDLTQKTLQSARENGLAGVPRAGLLWTLLGELLREKGKLDEAERCIERGLFLSTPEKPSLGWNYLFKIAHSFSKQDYQEALLTILEIENLHNSFELPIFTTFPATVWKARILFTQGDISGAVEILSGAGISPDTKIQGGQEPGYLLLSRIFLSTGDTVSARNLLEGIEQQLTHGGHRGLLLEMTLLKAALAEKTGSFEAAEHHLLSALQSGKESGYFQFFVDEKWILKPAFSRIIEKNKHDSSFKDMLGYILKIYPEVTPAHLLSSQSASKNEQQQGLSCHNLVEELSARELEILQLISEGLSNQDISQKLFLSVGTVKWHTSNIYGKLGVRGRTQAVALGKKLNLIS